MSHTSEKRWDAVNGVLSSSCTEMMVVLGNVEEAYQDLLELYAFCGNTAQGLADQLFFDVWSARSTPGVQAAITFDVFGGSLSAVNIVQAGSGYTDGTNYTLSVLGGNGDAVVSYDVIGGAFVNAAVEAAGTGYADGSGFPMDNEPAPAEVFDTQANAAEVSKAQDAIDAATSLHDMYQAASNQTVAAENRMSSFRRFT